MRPEEVRRGGSRSEVKLKDVLTAVTTAFARAKSSMDELSLEIAKKYQQDELMASMSPPFFAISEATVEVKLVIHRLEGHEMLVSIDSETLNKYPPHMVSTIDLKITPQTVRMYKSETGKLVPMSST